MPHYENVDSNIIAFFLNENGEHGMQDLFIQAFQTLALEKYKARQINKELQFNSPTIHRELGTSNEKRMDIVIEDESGSVMIIENKIYHWMANDLNEYWDHFHSDNFPENKKIGIVLSLHKIVELDPKFISITHQELNSRILDKIGPYLIGANPKYTTFLFDFIENKKRFYMDPSAKDTFEYLFENRTKVNEIIKAKEKLVDSVLHQVDQAGSEFRMARKTQRDYRYYHIEKTENFYYTILIRHILDSNPTYSVILEGNYVSQSDFDQLRMLALELSKEKTQVQVIASKPQHAWFHLLTVEIPFKVDKIDSMASVIKSTVDELHTISEAIVKKHNELKVKA